MASQASSQVHQAPSAVVTLLQGCSKGRSLGKQLMAALPVCAVVWGGDWNHAMEGPEYAGGLAGKAAIKGVLADRQLQVATRGLPHCIPGLFTIDHIAVPKAGQIVDVPRIVAEGLRGNRLSDHDACAAEIATS